MCSRCYFRIALGAKMKPLCRGGFPLGSQRPPRARPTIYGPGVKGSSPGPRCAPVLLTMQRATRLWIDVRYQGLPVVFIFNTTGNRNQHFFQTSGRARPRVGPRPTTGNHGNSHQLSTAVKAPTSKGDADLLVPTTEYVVHDVTLRTFKVLPLSLVGVVQRHTYGQNLL
jgi:hypothetical protein